MSTGEWKEKLKASLIMIDAARNKAVEASDQMRAEAVNFLKKIVVPAYEELEPVFWEAGRKTEIIKAFDETEVAILQIYRDGEIELTYAATVLYNDIQLLGRFYVIDPVSGQEHKIALDTEAGYFIYAITKDMIIKSVVDQYTTHAKRI